MKQLTESHDCVIPWSSVDLDLYHNYKPGKGADSLLRTIDLTSVVHSLIT